MKLQVPRFGESTRDYKTYRKLLSLWLKSMKEVDDGTVAAIILHLEGKAQQAVLKLPEEDLQGGQEAINNILHVLDEMFGQPTNSYQLWDDFYKITREQGESVRSFLIRFESAVKQLKDNEINLPDGVMSSCLLRSVNLSEPELRTVKAACSKDMKYSEVIDVLSKTFNQNTNCVKEESCIKHEPLETMFVKKQEPSFNVNDQSRVGDLARWPRVTDQDTGLLIFLEGVEIYL